MSTHDPHVDRILRGQTISNLPPSKSQGVIRIFLSSTFTDMAEERNYLMTGAYVRLRKYCQEKFDLGFEVVDMRWGVRDMASDDHSTHDLLMEEIDVCQKVSMGPTFVVLLGDRYGSCSPPSQIEAVEFETLLRHVNDHQRETLETWYRQDNNDTLQTYILQPKSRHPDWPWAEAESEILTTLRAAANAAMRTSSIAPQSVSKYHTSVTEQEVEHGLLEDKIARQRCLFFRRQLNQINTSHPLAWRWVDLDDDGVVDEDAQNKMASMRDSKIPGRLPPENMYNYDLQWWESDGKCGVDPDVHQEYLAKFDADFETGLRRLIDQSAHHHQRSLHGETLLQEAVEHARCCANRSRICVGRDALLMDIARRLAADTRAPLLLVGSPGVGTTTVMAQTAQMIRQTFNRNAATKDICIVRFLGMTPMSSTIASLLHNLCLHIEHVTGARAASFSDGVPNSGDELNLYFRELISVIPDNVHLTLVLDSLHHLRRDNSEDTDDFQWLQVDLPSNVKVVVSISEDLRGPITTLLNDCSVITIDGLTTDGSVAMLDAWLNGSERKLGDKQWHDVLDHYLTDTSHTAVYTKLTYNLLVELRSYDVVPRVTPTMEGLMNALLAELEQKHGGPLVNAAMRLLSMTRHGVTEQEIEDLLSLDDEVLTDVYQYHVPPVRRLPSALWKRLRRDLGEQLVTMSADNKQVYTFAHAQCIDFGRKCSPDSVEKQTTIRLLAEYFAGVWADTPKPFTYNEYQQNKLGLSMRLLDSTALRYVNSQMVFIPPKEFNEWQTRSWLAYTPRVYNERKLTELPAAIMQLPRQQALQMAVDHLFYDAGFLLAMVDLGKTNELLALFGACSLVINTEEDELHVMQIMLMQYVLQSDLFYLQMHPNSLVIALVAKLLDFYNCLPAVTSLIDQLDNWGRSFSALVAPCVQYGTGNGEVLARVSGHVGSISGHTLHDSILYSLSEKVIATKLDGTGNKFNRILNCELQGGGIKDMFHLSEVKHNPPFLCVTLSEFAGFYIVCRSSGITLGSISCKDDFPELTLGIIKNVGVVSTDLEDDILVLALSSNHVLLYSLSNLQPVHCMQCSADIVHCQVRSDRAVIVLSNGTVQVVWLTNVAKHVPLSFSITYTAVQFPRGTGGTWNLNIAQQVIRLIPQTKGRVVVCRTFCKRHYGHKMKGEMNNSNNNNKSNPMSNNKRDFFVLGTDSNCVFYVCAKLHRYPNHVMDSVESCIENDGVLCDVAITKHACVVRTTSAVYAFPRSGGPVVRAHRACGVVDGLAGGRDEGGEYVLVYRGADMEALTAVTTGKNPSQVELRRLMRFQTQRAPIISCTVEEEQYALCALADASLTVSEGSHVMAAHSAPRGHFPAASYSVSDVIAGRDVVLALDANKRHVSLWSAESGRRMGEVAAPGVVLGAGVDLSGEYLVVVTDDGLARVWQTENLLPQPAYTAILDTSLGRVWVLPLDLSVCVVSADGRLWLVDLVSGEVERPWPGSLLPTKWASLQGNRVVRVAEGGTSAQVVDLDEGSAVREITLSDRRYKSLLIYGDVIKYVHRWKDNLVFAMSSSIVCVNEVSNAMFPLVKDWDQRVEPQLSRSGKLYGVAQNNKLLMYFDLKQAPKRLHCVMDPLEYSITADDCYVAYLADAGMCVCLQRIQDGLMLAKYTGHVLFRSLVTGPDAAYVSVGCSDNRVYSYVIADPDVKSHDERLKKLSSRQKRKIDDHDGREENQAYQALKRVIAKYETQAYKGTPEQERKIDVFKLDLPFAEEGDMDVFSIRSEKSPDSAVTMRTLSHSISTREPSANIQPVLQEGTRLRMSGKNRDVTSANDTLSKVAVDVIHSNLVTQKPRIISRTSFEKVRMFSRSLQE